MKLNHDCVRDLLMYCEEKLDIRGWLDLSTIVSLPYKPDELFYTTRKLQEAGYLEVNISHLTGGMHSAVIRSITWYGHEFLDNIRDPEVWDKTTKTTSTFKTVSLDILSKTASQIISNLITSKINS